jgi:putative transposase
VSLLVRYSWEASTRVHAYALMTNHVHLLLTPTTPDGTSTLMQRLGQAYSRSFNHRHGRTGTLWEGRFRASPVTSDDYVLECHRYIELNPVRAGIVARPEQYRWSSHRANIGIEPKCWLTAHPTVAALGTTNVTAATCYRNLFDLPLDEVILAALRTGIHGSSTVGPPPVSDTCLTPGVTQR